MTREPRPGTANDLDPVGVFRIHPEYVGAAFDDQVLLYHLNRGETISLNATAGLILELLDGERSAAQVRQLLQETYPESAEDVGRDVDRTLRYLLQHGALDSGARTARKPKTFGIGWAKTGTTTLGECFKTLGFDHQSTRPDLVRDARQGDLRRILALAEKKDSFEDWPWPLLYRELDDAFPGSRFVLTVREPEKWLRSNRNMLRRPGYGTTAHHELRGLIFGFSFPDVTDEQLLRRYSRHNREVREYFRDRPGALLVVDWERGDGWPQLCGFLGVEVPELPFPHANRGYYG